MSAHLVERLELAISASDAPPPWRTALMRHLGSVELPQAIEDCFATITSGDPLIRIERLHIDLGAIEETDLPRSLIDPFIVAFSDATVQARHRVRSKDHGPMIIAEQSDKPLIDALDGFLSTGMYRPSSESMSPEEALSSILDLAPPGLDATLSRWLADASIRLRLGRQFSRTTLERVLAIAGHALDLAPPPLETRSPDLLALPVPEQATSTTMSPTTNMRAMARRLTEQTSATRDVVVDVRSDRTRPRADMMRSDRISLMRESAPPTIFEDAAWVCACLMVIANERQGDARQHIDAFQAVTTAIRHHPATIASVLRRISARATIIGKFVAFLRPLDLAALAHALADDRASARRDSAEEAMRLVSRNDWERYLHRLIKSRPAAQSSNQGFASSRWRASRYQLFQDARETIDASSAIKLSTAEGVRASEIDVSSSSTRQDPDTRREQKFRRRRLHRRRRALPETAEAVAALSGAMLAVLPTDILHRSIMTSVGRRLPLFEVLLQDDADPHRAATTLRSIIETLIDPAAMSRTPGTVLHEIAARQAKWSGIDAKTYLDRVRLTIAEAATQRTLDRGIARLRSERRQQLRLQRAHARDLNLFRPSLEWAGAIERFLESLPAEAFRAVLLELAGSRAAALDNFLDRSSQMGVGSTSDRCTLVSVALAAKRKREPVARIALRLLPTKSVAPLVSLHHPFGKDVDASRKELDPADWLDAATPSERSLMIEDRFGRNTHRVMALIEASAGPLARPTIEAILTVATDRRAPWAHLASSLATEAARRARVPLDVYCHAIGLGGRATGSRAALRHLPPGLLILDPQASASKDNKGYACRNARHSTTILANSAGRTGKAMNGIAAVDSLPSGLARTLRAYRPRSLLLRRLSTQRRAGRVALVRLLAGRDASVVSAWLDASERAPGLGSGTWIATLALLLDGPPYRGRTILASIVREAARRCGLSERDYSSTIIAYDQSGRLGSAVPSSELVLRRTRLSKIDLVRGPSEVAQYSVRADGSNTAIASVVAVGLAELTIRRTMIAAMRSHPADLILALSAFRPRSLLVRALVERLPRGIAYDLMGLLARRDARMITAWLEAADLTPDLGATTWTVAFEIALDLRSRRTGVAFRLLVAKAALRCRLSEARYREDVCSHDRSGRLVELSALAEREAERRSMRSRDQMSWQRRKVEASPAREADKGIEAYVHLQHLLAPTAPSVGAERQLKIGVALLSLWDRDPDAFVVALRRSSPRSVIVKALAGAMTAATLRAVISRLAGRQFPAIMALVDRFDSRPDVAKASWESVLLVLLRHDGRSRPVRGLLEAVIAEAARRSRLNGEAYALRIGYVTIRQRRGRTAFLDPDTPSHSIKTVARGTSVSTPDAERPASSIGQARRLARQRRCVELFLAVMSDDTAFPSDVEQPPRSAQDLGFALFARSIRPIAASLRAFTHDGVPSIPRIDRLSSSQVDRLLRPLSRGARPLVTALVKAADETLVEEKTVGHRAAGSIALACLLRMPTASVSPRTFAFAFVRALAAMTGRRHASIVTHLRGRTATGGSADRVLAAIRPARRVPEDVSQKTGSPRRRRSKSATAKWLDPFLDDRFGEPPPSDEIDRLVAFFANGSRRQRRRSARSIYDSIPPEAQATTHGRSDPQKALWYFLWYGSIQSSVDAQSLEGLQRRVQSTIGEGFRSPDPPGMAGLVARLRSLREPVAADLDQVAADADLQAMIAALTTAAETMFRRQLPSMRSTLAAMLDKAGGGAQLADGFERKSPLLTRRVAMLFSDHADVRLSTALLTHDAKQRHACDLFFHVLAQDSLPWWHPVQGSPGDILNAQIAAHPRAIARALVAGNAVATEASVLIGKVGLDATRPLIHALARRHSPLIQAMVTATQSILPSIEGRWIIALDTLLAVKSAIEPSSLISFFATRVSKQVECSVEKILAILAEGAGARTQTDILLADEARAALIRETDDRHGFFARPFEIFDGSGPVSIMHHRLRYGADGAAIDAAVREAFAEDPSAARDLAKVAIAQPVARARVATLPKPTLVMVLAALCGVPVRALRPLLERLALHPASIDPVLQAIGGGRADVEALTELVRSATPRPSPIVPPNSGPRWTSRNPGSEAAIPIRIENAGLVIVAPFLPRLFSGLELFVADGSLPPDAAQRCVHLLQYLAADETDAPEYHLVLNKLLCGLDVAVPLIASIVMEERETAMADSMLRGIMQNWPPLKTTSIAGLRETFLRREGFLRETPEAWVLTVTPGPFDMLLDQLRWPISVVRLRWMTKLLKVEWR